MSIEADRALLRRFEPIVRYTRGESFFPMDVEAYIGASSLWIQRPEQPPECLVPEGKLTLTKLGQPRAHGSDAVYFLKFIEPLNIRQLATYQLQRVREGLTKKDSRRVFHARLGRLARVGYLSRLVDALFSLTLLARGRVPGDTAAAAILEYQRLLSENERYCYYGRVVRQGGWMALQYWFFYPFNNWRSEFFGANDHEADWEMIYVYLSESEEGEVCPEWVAYASHDFSGDDLRRRWDDPELEKVGEHPVVYAGAGSHASYYTAGEYLAEFEMPLLSPLAALADRLQKLWQEIFGRGDGRARSTHWSELHVFRVPFVDYARGDGLSIGPGQEIGWDEPRMLEPLPAWASNYRGLWGLYARDPAAGEDAPAGPLYDRDGTMRRSWYDPLGWAGLDKLPPPDEVVAHLRVRRAALNARCVELTQEISTKSEELVGLGVESAAMHRRPHLSTMHATHQEKIERLSGELDQLRAQLAANEALLEAIDLHDERIRAGERGPARAHIHRAHSAATDSELRLGRFAEIWAAISIGLMLIGFVGLAIFSREHLILGLVAMVSLMLFIESGFRGELSRLVASVTTALAVVSALVLLFEFFWTVVVVVVLLAGGYIMWENLRELF